MNASASLARNAAWREANRARLAEHSKRVYWSDPEGARIMASAHQKMARAIKRGDFVRPDACEQCGKTGRTEAAHRDYRAPYDVRWLCRSCHVIWDRAEPKRRHR